MRRVSFIVDEITLFDALKAQNGDCSALGARLAELCMTGPKAINDIGLLAVYGISDTMSKTIERPSNAP